MQSLTNHTNKLRSNIFYPYKEPLSSIFCHSWAWHFANKKLWFILEISHHFVFQVLVEMSGGVKKHWPLKPSFIFISKLVVLWLLIFLGWIIFLVAVTCFIFHFGLHHFDFDNWVWFVFLTSLHLQNLIAT